MKTASKALTAAAIAGAVITAAAPVSSAEPAPSLNEVSHLIHQLDAPEEVKSALNMGIVLMGGGGKNIKPTVEIPQNGPVAQSLPGSSRL